MRLIFCKLRWLAKNMKPACGRPEIYLRRYIGKPTKFPISAVPLIAKKGSICCAFWMPSVSGLRHNWPGFEL